MNYFSEIEEGKIPRTIEDFNDKTWAGVRALIHAHIKDGAFGAIYSDMCEDGCGPIGCAEDQFLDALQAELPRIEKSYIYRSSEGVWETMDILDTIQFCWRCIGQPIQVDYHKFFQHHHLRFDIEAGREKFCEDINRIFRRNGLVYELTMQGTIERLVTPVLREKLLSFQFKTGDTELDCMLETAQRKFLNPDNAIRREALEKLWDAWERLKQQGLVLTKSRRLIRFWMAPLANALPNFEIRWRMRPINLLKLVIVFKSVILKLPKNDLLMRVTVIIFFIVYSP